MSVSLDDDKATRVLNQIFCPHAGAIGILAIGLPIQNEAMDGARSAPQGDALVN